MLESGYSGGHNVAPYLNPSIWVPFYIVANNVNSQGRWLSEGKEIEVFSSTDELIEKVRYYLAPENADLRECIAAAGQSRTVTEHRAAWFERIVSLALHERRADYHAPALNVESTAHPVATVASARSAAFAAVLVEHLLQHFPPGSVHVICLDEATRTVFAELGLP